MRRWTVGGALVLGPEGLLLVANRRKNGSIDWSTPGGVIDEGTGEADPLLHAATELAGEEVIDAVEPHGLQTATDTLADLRLLEPTIAVEQEIGRAHV